MPESDAIALLQDLDPEGALGLRDAPDELLRKVARCCHGLPRALETVAGILANAPTLQLREFVGDTTLFTEQVVEVLVAEHFRRATDDQRRVLEALAVYGKPIPAAAVRYLLAPYLPDIDVPALLTDLVRNYFVTYSRSRDTYELHPIDREHAYVHIPDEGAYCKSACHARAADFYAELRKPQEEWKSLPDLEPQLDEFDQRMLAGDNDGALHVLNAIDFHYLALWGYSELVIGLRGGLLNRLADTYLERVNRKHLGFAYNRLCRAEDAIQCFETLLALFDDQGEYGELTAEIKGNLARSLLMVGRVEEAISLLEDALWVAQSLYERMHGWGSRVYEGLWSGALGEALLRLGKPQTACEYLRDAVYISQVEGDQRWQVRHLCNLAEMHRQLGDETAALEALREALQMSGNIGNRHGEGFSRAGLAQLHHAAGRLDEARVHYERGLAIGLPPSNCRCAVKLGVLHLEQGRPADAADCFHRGLAMCAALLEKTPRLYEILYLRALAELGHGRVAAALDSFREALGVCSARGVVEGAILDVRLLQRAVPTANGLSEILILLEASQNIAPGEG